MSIDSKYIFVDVEFLKSIVMCIDSLKKFDEYEIEDKAMIMASSDMVIEQINELVDEFEG